MPRLTKADILLSAATERVRYVRLQFTDLFGILKNVEIPVTQLETALDGQIMIDGSSIHGFARIEESDMYLMPDYDTWLVLPWTFNDFAIARIICSVHLPDNVPFAGDPRHILKRTQVEYNRLGFDTPRFSVELEYFLVCLDEHGDPTSRPSDDIGYFDLAPEGAGESCRQEVVVTLRQMGIEVLSSHHETAPGQQEIDLSFSDAVTAADQVMTAKMVVKSIARRHGLHATFMPKPFEYADGSGLHTQMTMQQDGQDAFRDIAQPHGLSQTGKSFIAGLLTHAPAITAITNPLVNSYKRLVPGFEAPAHIFWSTNHRMPFVRVTDYEHHKTVVELRSPDACCNPYLSFSVILKAGLDGLQKQLTPPDPLFKSPAGMSEEERFAHEIFRLPANLEEALEALEEDETIRECLGEHAFTHYLQAKLAEWQAYRKAIHPWELNRYLSLY
ncbi:type I glutamate--ammonia ligase [Alicyclobacillus acidiphilus]|uniref:type I glutamate--ammonia ligase n=1 Tax=Alicyclobacillus acidiphilus TaxID=182455 RepID=UPI00082F8A82|nr:type I glutamate--ammonia ligase [Alicyclobacillus acidiphilus]